MPGGTRERPLEFLAPPPIPLDSDKRPDLLEILAYAGIHYSQPTSPAAAFGTSVFETGRDFARQGPFQTITFDWDHTLSNFLIFEDIPKLLRVRMLREAPPQDLAATPMTAIEIARPFMHELTFGMMIGFALGQGLKRFDQWENYQPQVGIPTHTWPDRIGVLAAHFVRILPLMEGLFPGSAHVYEMMTDAGVRSVAHLHHFLDYADDLITRFDRGGFTNLSKQWRADTLAYFEEGKAHHHKPLGALTLRGWDTSSFLHFDDSTTVIKEIEAEARERAGLKIRGIWVRQPHSRFFQDVKEWNKIASSGLWRPREAAARGAVTRLARMEWTGCTMPALLTALGGMYAFSGDEGPSVFPEIGLPEGVRMMIHETPTTLGEYWRYYVEPTGRRTKRIRDVRAQHGGLKAIRRDYRKAVALGTPPESAAP